MGNHAWQKAAAAGAGAGAQDRFSGSLGGSVTGSTMRAPVGSPVLRVVAPTAAPLGEGEAVDPPISTPAILNENAGGEYDAEAPGANWYGNSPGSIAPGEDARELVAAEGNPSRSPAGFDTDPEESLRTGPANEAADAAEYAMWVDLVDRIRSGQTDGMAELYHLFSTGIRFFLCRQLGAQELDDKVHDTFVVVVQAIRKGELREPERLMGFVRTVVRRQVAAHIDKAIHTRREQMDMETTLRIADPRGNPEEAAMFRQRVEIIRKVLDELPARDKEILTRFYLREQSQEQICREMELTETQFRLLKSRAKARFGEIGKKKLASKALQAVFVRTSAGYSH
ncbi:MAG: sigma-70 family RNA polymerase sigma factor [Bryobacteraceae bacterium]